MVETTAFRSSTAVGYKLAWLACVLFLAGPASAQETEDDVEPPPIVDLDSLFRLPSSASVGGEIARRGGSTRPQWQRRFESARNDVDDSSHALQQARTELKEKAPQDSNWRMAAPGLGPGTQSTENPGAPLDYRLSQELRRAREELERSERLLREIEIEADLAGVPADWRQADPR